MPGSTTATISGTAATGVAAPGAVVVTPNIAAGDAAVGATIAPTDRALLDAVVSALSSDPALRGARLAVTVKGGVVSVSGSAVDNDQAVRARSVAASAAGNARVEADISAG